MLKYIGQRILIGVFSLFVLITVAFFLTRKMPGSPFQTGSVADEVLHSIEARYGLDQPVINQYQTYLGNILHGDFGESLRKPGVTVSAVIIRAWPVTAVIGSLAVVLAMVLGTLLGIWQASTHHRFVKKGIFLGTILGTGIPNFIIALMLVLVFGVKLKWLPTSGLNGPQNYILPVISLAVYPTAVVSRLMNNTFSWEMKQDYVVMARAKGLHQNTIGVFHILKNAWIPVLNYIGPAAAFLLTGSFVVESIFTIPGLGREFVTSIVNRDYTVILGLTVFMGMVVILINLLVDVLCAWLDPRIRRWQP